MITVTKKFKDHNEDSFDGESTITISASARTVMEATAIIKLEFKRYLLELNRVNLNRYNKANSIEIAEVEKQIKEIQ